MKTHIKIILGILIGAIAGYCYYYFIGCNGDSCSITSNWYITTLYGAAFGLILAFPTKKRNGKIENTEDK